jgi:streptogramin lyase
LGIIYQHLERLSSVDGLSQNEEGIPMAVQEINCPNCGAPLNYDGSDSPTMRCPFCNTVVAVPEEIRPARPIIIQGISVPSQRAVGQPARTKSGAGPLILIAAFIILLIAGFAALPILISRQQETAFSNSLNATQTARVFARMTAASEITPTPEPTMSPTPSFAQAAMRFGQNGIGEGMFNDARYIAVDGSGSIYVADYEGGRIQRFDSSGKYQSQWRVGDSQTIIYGMSANHQGDVYVSYDTVIGRYDGKTGKLLSTLSSPNGGTFGDLYATADGHLVATWYEGRWGLITSLDGHRDDLVIFDAEDKIASTIPSIISGQTNSLALDNYLAVDGTGTIFVLSDAVLFKFSPVGKYINSFNGAGSQSGQYGSPNAFAVDGQGRLYFVDGDMVHVYSPDWRSLDSFPTGVNLDMLAIDDQGVLWGVSRDQVTKFILRGN